MKEKSQIEKKAGEKQVTLLSAALSEASNAGGHWLNASGKGYPRFYPRGVSVSAFNALFMALHSDKNGCKTNLFTPFSEVKAQGAAVCEHEQGVPFLFYNWNRYVHRNHPERIISRDDYMKLDEGEQKQYKGVHNREIRTLFNIDQTTLPYVDRELRENPCLIDALESDVNNALEVIRKAERGERIEYATMRNRRQTSEMKEQMPKHFFVANEIRQHPNKEDKTIVLVIDPSSKSADVILPAGASPEVDNEVPGMNKARIGRALRREGIENVRFFNPDGTWGYRPDDSYFAEKQVSLARLKNWTLEMLSTLDVAPAVRRANEVNIDRAEMIQDDKKRWALYIKPENRKGYSVYPDKEDVNLFFSTLKQAMDNMGKVRMELAHKYYALAEVQPDLKVDLFGSDTREIDLNRIQRVSVFNTNQDGRQCVATIDGKKMQPRSVTPQQWQRVMVAENKTEYKRHLAATLFADVLQKGQSQEEHAGEKQEKENLQRQGRETTTKRTDEVVQEPASPRNGLSIENLSEQLYGRYKEIKDKQPEAIVLFKHEGSYYASMYDAETIANELDLPPQKERLSYDPDKMILVFGHDNEETGKQILALRAYTIDCAAPELQQETGEQNENEQHTTFRR